MRETLADDVSVEVIGLEPECDLVRVAAARASDGTRRSNNRRITEIASRNLDDMCIEINLSANSELF